MQGYFFMYFFVLFTSFFLFFPLFSMSFLWYISFHIFCQIFIKVGNLLAQYRIKRLAVITCSLKNVCIPMKLKWKSLQWSLFAQDKQVHLDKKEMVGLAKNEGRDKLTQRELTVCSEYTNLPQPFDSKILQDPLQNIYYSFLR